MLAIHGTPGSRLMFALTDHGARARKLRIIAPERPGYGLSDFRRSRVAGAGGGRLEAFADALGLDRFAVIGVSGGGPYAVAAAAAMPERTVLLALISPVGPIAECHGRIRMSKLHRLIFTRIGRSSPAIASFFWSLRHLVRWAPGIAYRALMQRVPRSDRTVLARARGEGQPSDRAQRGAETRHRRGASGSAAVLRALGSAASGHRRADRPVAGQRRPIVPPGAAYDLAETLPNCRLDVIQGGGHYWVFGEFDRVLDAVQAALRR